MPHTLHVLRTLLACSTPVQLGEPPVDSLPPPVDSTAEAGPRLFINELMAESEGSYVNADGQPVDWFELYNPEDAAVDLEGWSVSDDWTAPRRHVFGPGVEVPARGYLVLEAAGAELPGEGVVLPFSLNRGGEPLGVFDAEGEAVDWIGFPSLRADHAWARIPDGGDAWTEMPVGTPGATNGVLVADELLAVAAGAEWAYFDQGRDLGTAWREPDYDDSGWARGPAPLGYGDELATTVEGGSSSSRHPTTYFRHRFSLEAGFVEGLFAGALGLQVDDGAIVWLNGQELGRVRMPDGEVAYGDWAAAVASGSGETTFNDLDVDVSLLRAGENVLAVEVHQANASSSDIRMDLECALQALVEAR
ncbi:MAG: lamin tail domain-containing protein [Alphaproteobacteria bacterium]|nr:lamin tail domain-containing protein [Alphaproteobacteria bacterium]